MRAATVHHGDGDRRPMHQAAGYLGASLMMVGGVAVAKADQVAAGAASQAVLQNIGWATVATGAIGLLGQIVTQGFGYLKDQREKRRIKARNAELAASLEVAHAEIAKLKAGAEQIPATEAHVAALTGRVDEMEILVREGVFQAPTPPTLLFVEDDPKTTEAFTRLFTRHGYMVDHASTVDDARARLKKHPTLVVVDRGLPGGADGLELVREIRKQGIGARVIVMTAKGSPEEMTEAQSLKPDALLIKPFPPGDLISIIAPDRGNDGGGG